MINEASRQAPRSPICASHAVNGSGMWQWRRSRADRAAHAVRGHGRPRGMAGRRGGLAAGRRPGDAVGHAGDRSLPGFPPAVRRAVARAARTDRGHSGGRLLPRRRHHPAAGRRPDPLPACDRQGGGGAPPDRRRWRLGAGGNARRGGDVRAAVAAVALAAPVGRGRPPGCAGLPDPCRAGRAAAAPAWLRGAAGPSGRRPATTCGRCWPGACAPGPVLGARRRADRPAAGHLRPERDGGRSGRAHAR